MPKTVALCVSRSKQSCVYTWLTHRSAYTPCAERPRAFNVSIIMRIGQLRDLASLLETGRDRREEDERRKAE